MKAVIMAGGEGTRLRPLTCTLPKPMARMCGTPVLTYILDLLSVAGIKEAILTLKYMPNSIIEYFNDDEYKGIKLEFVIEDEFLGTAGSVKNALADTNESVLVMSGDALCDFSLKEIIKAHNDNSADVTITSVHVDDPREYGLLQVDENSFVTGFLEKPGWGQANCDIANTGIYILEPSAIKEIPSGVVYDFAKELFPKLLSQQKKLYSYVASGYWCDIGDLESYRMSQIDMLTGKVSVGFTPVAEGIYAKTALPKGDFVVIPPAYIGDGVQIENGAVIGPGTVIDDNCLIGAGSKIRESIILENSYVSSLCSINSAIVSKGASIKKGASLFEGSAVGANAIIGEYATVNGGVLIWPNREVTTGANANDNLKYGVCSKIMLVNDGLEGDFGVELTPERAAILGSAVASVEENVRVGVGADGYVNSQALKYGLLGGLISCGARVWDFSTCFPAQMHFFTAFCGLTFGIYISGGKSGTSIRISEKGGLSLTRNSERDICANLAKSEFKRSGHDQCKSVTDMQSVNMMYMRELCSQATVEIEGTKLEVISSNTRITDVMAHALLRLGCVYGSDDLIIKINETGTRGSIIENGMGYSFEKLLAVAAYHELKSGADVALPWDAPHIITNIGNSLGRNVYRYAENPVSNTQDKAREAGIKQLWARDALFLSVRILSIMREREKTLKELVKELPEFYVANKNVDIDVSPARISKKLIDESFLNTDDEGIVFSGDKGYAKVKVKSSGDTLKIITESVSIEAAEELCSDIEAIINRISIDIKDEK